MLGGIGGRRRRGRRGWDGWMVSRTRWTWVWVNSGRCWWTGMLGVLQFMGSQGVGHNWVTKLNWCRESCQLQTVRVLLLLSPSGFLLFLFLLWLLWPKLPELCGIEVVRVGTLVLFLDFRRIGFNISPLRMMFAESLSYMALDPTSYWSFYHLAPSSWYLESTSRHCLGTHPQWWDSHLVPAPACNPAQSRFSPKRNSQIQLSPILCRSWEVIWF